MIEAGALHLSARICFTPFASKRDKPVSRQIAAAVPAVMRRGHGPYENSCISSERMRTHRRPTVLSLRRFLYAATCEMRDIQVSGSDGTKFAEQLPPIEFIVEGGAMAAHALSIAHGFIQWSRLALRRPDFSPPESSRVAEPSGARAESGRFGCMPGPAGEGRMAVRIGPFLGVWLAFYIVAAIAGWSEMRASGAPPHAMAAAHILR